MADDFKYCAARVREFDRDRYLATLFAPADRRGALFALYAFNVEMSRVRDLAREPMPGEIRLQWWREVISGEREGEARANPIAAALMRVLANHRVPAEKLLGLVEAHRFDIYNEPMTDFAEFQSYASRSIGPIFELAGHILCDAPQPALAAMAAEAAQAQLAANVVALLPRHAAHQQLYIPQDTLRHYGARPEDVFAMRATPEVRATLAELRLRGRRHLARVATADSEIPARAQPAFLSLAPLRPWFLDMERPGYDPFNPPQMAAWRRQWLIWRAARSFRRIGN